MPAATSRALLCLAALCLSAPAARAGPACVGTSEQNLIANQTEQAYYCALDGSQDDVQFQVTNVHSVNNDQYHLHAVVYPYINGEVDYSTVVAETTAGPWHDNFDHTVPVTSVAGSGGTYLKVLLSVNWYCDAPGSGASCQIVHSERYCDFHNACDSASALRGAVHIANTGPLRQ